MSILFRDLFIRMLIIVGVFDFLMWWILGKQKKDKVLYLFIIEMIAITLSLWFDIIYRSLP
jgi:hypothetical protein